MRTTRRRVETMIDFLRSKIATLAVLVLALVAQLPHAAEVFMQAGAVHGAWAVLHGGAYAMALELAVLLFVVQGHRSASYAFAGVSVLVNLAYYAERVQLFSVHGLSAWLISVALPVAIALYSHAVADAHESFDALAWLRAWRLRTVAPAEDAQPVATVHSAELAPSALEPAQPDAPIDDAQPIDARSEALNMHSEGMTPSEIARLLQQKESTVRSWIRRNNGATKERA
jgi:DNA-directed RNA polymerase specialized sigma24 family protein